MVPNAVRPVFQLLLCCLGRLLTGECLEVAFGAHDGLEDGTRGASALEPLQGENPDVFRRKVGVMSLALRDHTYSASS